MNVFIDLLERRRETIESMMTWSTSMFSTRFFRFTRADKWDRYFEGSFSDPNLFPSWSLSYWVFFLRTESRVRLTWKNVRASHSEACWKIYSYIESSETPPKVIVNFWRVFRENARGSKSCGQLLLFYC